MFPKCNFFYFKFSPKFRLFYQNEHFFLKFSDGELFCPSTHLDRIIAKGSAAADVFQKHKYISDNDTCVVPLRLMQGDLFGTTCLKDFDHTFWADRPWDFMSPVRLNM